MEVLVVIVIFLVGLLAVVQIFPKGFQILLTTRSNSVASSLARNEIERYKSMRDQLPEAILPVLLVGGSYITDPTYNPNSLDSQGDRLLINGFLQRNGGTLGPWPFHSGANAVKRVVGEGGIVPAARANGAGAAYYGGLRVLMFGPIDYRPANGGNPSNVSVYGNDLVARFRAPDANEVWVDGQYYVTGSDSNAITVHLPSGPLPREYRVAFSAYVQSGGNYVKRDYIDVARIPVPATSPDIVTGKHPLYSQTLQGLIAPTTLGTVDVNTLSVQRSYYQLAKNDAFGNDPYQYKLLDTNIGVLLFNPLANSTYINKPSGREPLMARVNYDVYDWRVLKDDFRLALSAGTQQYKLSVGSLKVAGDIGPDGLRLTNILTLESAPSDPAYSDTSDADEARANNLVIVDLDNGGVVMERLPSDNRPPQAAANPLVTVNKTTGVVTFHDVDGNPNNGTQGKILLADGSVIDVTLENRALRALYRVKNEFSVQVLKAASRYTLSSAAPPGAGQYYIDMSLLNAGTGVIGTTRIYFPRMDAGRKVNVGEINYISGGQRRQIIGQDFIIRTDVSDPLPYIDIVEADSGATGLFLGSGAAVKDVKGASLAVRVLWNPDSFFLTSDPIENMYRLDKWGQGWRKNTNETFIERGEVSQW